MPANNKLDQLNLKGYLKPANKYTKWKIVSLVVIGLLAVGVILTFYFVYQYTYTTLSNANVIILLNSNLNVDPIDNKAYQLSQNILKLKKEEVSAIPDNLRNIFYYVEGQSTTTTKTTKNNEKN